MGTEVGQTHCYKVGPSSGVEMTWAGIFTDMKGWLQSDRRATLD